MQTVNATPVDTVPVGQLMQELDPVEEAYFPLTHDEHVVVPVTAVYVPAPQLVHDATVVPEKVPKAQGTHCELSNDV